MRTEKQIDTPANQDVACQVISPAELWLDTSIEPEQLIELDPLDITHQMVELAEHPELADPLIRDLPPRNFSLKREALERKLARARLREFSLSLCPSGGLSPGVYPPRLGINPGGAKT